MSGKTKRDKPWMFRTYAGHSTAKASNELYRQNLVKGADGAFGRFRPADPDRLRFRRPARPRRGWQGRRADLPSRRHAGADAGHSARRDEHLDDHQCHRGLALVALRGARRRAGRRPGQAHRHGAERHHQGISLARHLCVPAQALAQADQGRDRLRLARDSEMEPDQCLLLPFAGGRSDADARACLCARHGRGRARRGEELRRSVGGRISATALPHLVLRQCRRPLHHRGVQDARLRRSVGRDRREALRRHRPGAQALPLRRAGELAGAHRAAAREQRLSHPALHARGDAVEEGARPRRAASGLERGARPAAPLGPAMVAQAPADRGLRDRPPRIRRHFRRLRGHRPQGRGPEERRPRRTRPHPGDGRSGRRHRLHERDADRGQCRPRRGHREGRAGSGRRQRLYRDRAGAAVSRRRRHHHRA